MEVLVKNTQDYIDTANYPNCDINCIHIKITDLAHTVGEMSSEIADTSWISNLSEFDQMIYNATAKRTISKIIDDILAQVASGLNTDIGEYLVSYSAQNALVSHYTHTKIPLAELFKEKISGNPGFDFHTISTKKFIIFGEAKFSMKGTPRDIALSQIKEFIALKKDHAELGALNPFIEDDIRTNILSGMKGYAAAFSFNAQNIDTILQNALQDEAIAEIARHNELFIIAVEVC